MDATPVSEICIVYETAPSKQIHWHDSLQIQYQLTGKAKATLQGRQYLMHEADVIVINPFELHNVELLGASTALSFCFPQQMLGQIRGMQFDCISCAQPKQNGFDALRTELAALFQIYFGERPHGQLELLSHVYELFHQLIRFRREEHMALATDQPRVSRILQYLHTRYAEEVTLRDLATQEYLSPNYLSQFFRDKLDTTFTQYLSDIRLDHGFFELCNTAKSITNIALDNGFGRVDTFIERFRRKYGTTPGKFRKGLAQFHSLKLIPTCTQAIPERPPGTRFQTLLRYGAQEQTEAETAAVQQPSRKSISVRARQRGKPIAHDWRTIINAGYADDCCTAEVQEQIARVQTAIGFEYVQFHGIFSDSMHFYDEDEQGKPYLHFTYVDLLLDRLLAQQLKMFLEFSFLPQALAPRKSHVYQNHSYIGFPNDLDKWCALVRGFLTHCISRNGLSIVRQWKFTLFSITFSLYGFLTLQEYYQLYRETWRTVKSVDPELQFGGPGIEGSLLLNTEDQTVSVFLQQCLADGCIPDFLTMHSFPHSFDEIASDFNRIVHQNDLTASFGLSSNENFMADALAALKQAAASLGLGNLPVWIDEWDSTIWQRDLCSDTCYKAVYIVKNMLENMDQTKGKAYWTVSDLINDWKIDGKLFHGGHGLITYNGIPKASFYAYELLAHMGHELLDAGDGWYVTRSAAQIQILLYHYCHYNTMYRMLFEFHAPSERYSAFQKKAPVEYEISIPDAEGKSFVCEYFRIGRNSGSSLDEWIRLGAPEELSADNLAYLKHRSEPVRWMERRGTLTDIKVTLEPLEVVQIIINTHEE